MDSSLISAQKLLKTKYEEDGYCYVEDFFTAQETRSLEKEIRSARERFPSGLSKNGLVFRQHLYFHSAFIRQLLSQPKMVDLLRNFIGPSFWLRKDQGVFKKPGGIEFPWHQDNGYNGIRDAYLQLWIPLTKMNAENGALSILPGSHRNGILPHRYEEPYLVWNGGDVRHAVTVEAKPGDVLLFSSLLLHRSGPNNTREERIAYVAELMSSDHYDPDATPPYFQMAADGKPDPRFVRFYKGNLLPQNRLKYLFPRTLRNLSIWKGHVGKIMRRFSPSLKNP